MKRLVSAFLAGAMALSLAACGGAASTSTVASSASASGSAAASETAASDLDYIKEKGKMVIGYTVYEPMNYTDADGNFTGFDTELATAVCEKLGVEPEFVEINWDTKVVELDAKSIDCIWNGMTLTEDIMANTATTKAYAKNAQVVVVKESTAYTSTADLAGKTVVAEAGSAGEAAIQGDENLAKADYVSKSVQTDCLMEVAGRCRCAGSDPCQRHDRGRHRLRRSEDRGRAERRGVRRGLPQGQRRGRGCGQRFRRAEG